MPKREARGKKARGAASGAVPTDALAEAETLIERAERQIRFREYPKAQRQLEAAVHAVVSANLASDASGCLLLASATGSLLEIDKETQRLYDWALNARASANPEAQPAAVASAAVAAAPLPPLAAQPLTAAQRVAALREAEAALEAGYATLSTQPHPDPSELSTLCEARAQIASLYSEAVEEAGKEAGEEAGEEAGKEAGKEAGGGALEGVAGGHVAGVSAALEMAFEMSARALSLYEEAGRQHLLGQAGTPTPHTLTPPP